MQLGQVSRTTREQQRIREPEAEIRAMCKQLVEKDEVIDILKKIRRHSVETIADQCHCIQMLQRQGTPVEPGMPGPEDLTQRLLWPGAP